MAATQILLKNPKALPLSIDAKINSDLVIRQLLAPLGDANGHDQYDVSGKATLDDLNRNAQIRALLDHETVPGVPDPLITIELIGGTNDVAGSDSATSVANAAGLGGVETLVVAVPDQLLGGANDLVLLAAMPYTALIIDYQIMVDFANAGETWELRDTAGGAGAALSDALAAGATGRVRDASTALAGVVPTLAAGDLLVLRRAVGDAATGYVIVTFQRLS